MQPSSPVLDIYQQVANWIVPVILVVAVNYLRQIGSELKTIAVEMGKIKVRLRMLERAQECGVDEEN